MVCKRPKLAPAPPPRGRRRNQNKPRPFLPPGPSPTHRLCRHLRSSLVQVFVSHSAFGSSVPPPRPPPPRVPALSRPSEGLWLLVTSGAADSHRPECGGLGIWREGSFSPKNVTHPKDTGEDGRWLSVNRSAIVPARPSRSPHVFFHGRGVARPGPERLPRRAQAQRPWPASRHSPGAGKRHRRARTDARCERLATHRG